ncbi:MAG: 4-(cytidine 5'-diphospho)-2-C-methyl-D-erythritol kinase [Planctomycetes bacterium]|nr:4-(cytidine 5'-diphospho)-2-C-methyl-D-erythritol kinase [Planctomycetota bacterium]MCB9918475.1 4-(cytidine 5'-diphospho)-2-C-methyl-D-erythritol kinase [Planctomycetota bacterium]
MPKLRTRAFAKINLSLAVRGKREDGYHDLDTLFDEIDFGEDIAFEVGTSGEFTLSLQDAPSVVPAGDDNLVLRAARLLQRTLDLDIGGRFFLEKRIPAGAGLGGGSADAAAALRLVAAAANLDIESPDLLDRLESLGRELGADVPFFVRGGRAFARGRGDEPTPCSAEPRLYFVLILPALHCDTGRVFSRWHRELNRRAPSIGSDESASASGFPEPVANPQTVAVIADGGLAGVFNDLTAAAMRAYPELDALRNDLSRACAVDLHLSGSGSTLFAVTSDAHGHAKQRSVLESAVGSLAASHDEVAPIRVLAARSVTTGARAVQRIP